MLRDIRVKEGSNETEASRCSLHDEGRSSARINVSLNEQIIEKAIASHRVKRHASLHYSARPHCLLTTRIKDCTEHAHRDIPPTDLECSICFEKLHGCSNLLSLKECGYIFHKDCLRAALNVDPKCPICRRFACEPQGKMPSGKMTIELDEKLICTGFEPGTWKAGVQECYHANPGVAFPATMREAYIPNTAEGRRLLKRLTYAFSRGLTFSVGTSLTSGKENVIIC